MAIPIKAVTPGELAESAKKKLPELAESAKEKLPELAESAKEKLPELAESAKEKLPELAESAKEKLPELAESAKEKLPELAEDLKNKISSLPEAGDLPDALSQALEKIPKPSITSLPTSKNEKSDNSTPVYSKLDQIPSGRASDTITEGCLVLEGGAFRGLYTQGVLDALMEAGINFQTTIGISAGALSGLAYVSGQIGWSARLNLKYRHDSNYIGIDAMKKDHGITGFSFIFQEAQSEDPLDVERFMDNRRRFLCVATNMKSGQPDFFEKGKCRHILRAVQASATVPYVSRPVVINHTPYLDGGVVLNIPYHWAKREGFHKILVVKTRDHAYRKEIKVHDRLNYLFYHNYPNLLKEMRYSEARYDCLLDEIDTDEASGAIFVMAPEKPVEISRFEGDLEKLGDLYWEGYHEMQARLPELVAYLKK
ncbi:MAG: hypothetical protein PUF56_01890 [Lachnospiraceae bacterium]|nr:hypothetical protein [Lachnospiraceae bacterium]